MAAESFRQVGPGRLEVREGGGCLSLFGIPFLAAGLLGVAVATGLITLDNPSNVTMTLPAAIVIGAAFTLVGGVLVGRKWTTVSAADRTAVVQCGLLVPMREKIHYLDGYTVVRVEFVRGDSDTADQYPVIPTGPGRSQLRLFGSTKYAEARERAVAVAILLSLKIEDATTARAKQISAAEANLPLHMRARLEHERRDRVERPATLRSHITEANGIVTIVIPAARTPGVFFFCCFSCRLPSPSSCSNRSRGFSGNRTRPMRSAGSFSGFSFSRLACCRRGRVSGHFSNRASAEPSLPRPPPASHRRA